MNKHKEPVKGLASITLHQRFYDGSEDTIVACAEVLRKMRVGEFFSLMAPRGILSEEYLRAIPTVDEGIEFEVWVAVFNWDGLTVAREQVATVWEEQGLLCIGAGPDEEED